MKKTLLIIFSFIYLSSPPLPKELDLISTAWKFAHSVVKNYKPDLAKRYANVYESCSLWYDVPIKILLGLGETESEFEWNTVGDNGLSFGTHQVKVIYSNHINYLKSCDYGSFALQKIIENRIKKGRKIYYQKYMSRIGYNTQVATMKLRGLYEKYNSWGIAVLGYGCGEYNESFKNLSNNYTNSSYVKKVFRYYEKEKH